MAVCDEMDRRNRVVVGAVSDEGSGRRPGPAPRSLGAATQGPVRPRLLCGWASLPCPCACSRNGWLGRTLGVTSPGPARVKVSLVESRPECTALYGKPMRSAHLSAGRPPFHGWSARGGHGGKQVARGGEARVWFAATHPLKRTGA
jgi:hypothetical protein